MRGRVFVGGRRDSRTHRLLINSDRIKVCGVPFDVRSFNQVEANAFVNNEMLFLIKFMFFR